MNKILNYKEFLLQQFFNIDSQAEHSFRHATPDAIFFSLDKSLREFRLPVAGQIKSPISRQAHAGGKIIAMRERQLIPGQR